MLFITRASFGDHNLPALLHKVGMEALSSGRPYLRGDVIGPRETLFAGTSMEALYVSIAVYLPASFAAYTSPEGLSCALAWLVPITSQEAQMVREQGWDRFEDLLCQSNPDLLDVGRPSIVADV